MGFERVVTFETALKEYAAWYRSAEQLRKVVA
jgi:hypothetical protein